MVFALKGTKQWMTMDIENQAHQHLHILRALIYEHENKKKIVVNYKKIRRMEKNHEKIFFSALEYCISFGFGVLSLKPDSDSLTYIFT